MEKSCFWLKKFLFKKINTTNFSKLQGLLNAKDHKEYFSSFFEL
jgi:hypothetical protein